MDGANAEAPFADGSALCGACGLCCDRSLFDRVLLEPDEIDWAASKRLPLVQHGVKLSFKQSCAVLEVRGRQRVCGDYLNRPTACRTFECKLLASYRRGETPWTQALDLVTSARSLIASIERRLPGGNGSGDVPAQLDALDAALQGGAEGTRALDPELLLDLCELRSRILPVFRDPGTPKPTGARELQSLVDTVKNRETWQRLFAPFADDMLTGSVELRDGDSALTELRDEGYAKLDGLLTCDEASALASMVARLTEAGWAAPFLFLHPAPWSIPRRLERWLGTILGDDHELLSAFWVWHLSTGPGPGTAQRGWRPHRDRAGVSVQQDGTPDLLSVWVALTDATPENGCMYVLPPACDPHYGKTPTRADVYDIQNVRALPARAGSALAWNHQLLHWGGQVSARARQPRASIGFEFRRKGAADATRALDRGRLPTFDERIRFVAEQVLRYEHISGAERRLVALAARLAEVPPRSE